MHLASDYAQQETGWVHWWEDMTKGQFGGNHEFILLELGFILSPRGVTSYRQGGFDFQTQDGQAVLTGNTRGQNRVRLSLLYCLCKSMQVPYHPPLAVHQSAIPSLVTASVHCLTNPRENHNAAVRSHPPTPLVCWRNFLLYRGVCVRG